MKLTILLLMLSLSVFAADTLDLPKTSPEQRIRASDGRYFPASVVYTTDGNGTIIPIPGSSSSPSAVTLPTGSNTPSISSSTSSGSVTSGAIEISILAQSGSDGSVLGVSLAEGQVATFRSAEGKTLSEVTYNANGSTFKILEVR